MIKKAHASEQQKFVSRSKIIEKLRVLNQWAKGDLSWQVDDNGNMIRDSNGDKIVEWFPRNSRQFCEWDIYKCSPGTRKVIPKLNTFSRQTFSRELLTLV